MFENGLLRDIDTSRDITKLLQKRAKRLREERAKQVQEEAQSVQQEDSDQDGDSDEASDEDHDNKRHKGGKVYEDSEYLRGLRDFGPEDTYEIWLQEKHINKNFDKFLEKPVKKKKSKKSANEELFQSNNQQSQNNSDQEDQNEDQNDNDDDDDGNNYDDDDESGSKSSKIALSKGRYKIKKQGLEILPYIDTIEDDLARDRASYILGIRLPYSRKHTFILTKLLHLNILKRNWDVAYRCFSILIRVPFIGIRSIWPLGIEVLTRLSEEKFKQTQPENSIDFYQLKTMKTGNLSTRLGQFKDEQFLTWLQNFYPPTRSQHPTFMKTPQPFRISSKITAPVFVLNLIWTLIMKQDFQKVNDKLSEMLLQPPYINDGTFFFLQGFSYQLEASQLCHETKIDKSKIEILIQNCKKFYKEAKEKNATFPEDLVNNELNFILRKISDVDMNLGDDEDEEEDDDKDEEEDEEEEETKGSKSSNKTSSDPIDKSMMSSPSNGSTSNALNGIKTEPNNDFDIDMDISGNNFENDDDDDDDESLHKFNSPSKSLSTSSP
ncbi:RNA polymerase I-specific transcription initiation factor RRN11 [Wickerhamomyces ciferrii]|uniref:RNA polymerase I-specific transcription initiation factor RRN11 n=1 Tax=Wickerhamomyces ciferrii (strain ATCC 14091 / BCRC 22168 / CBS 111 / JCM 3599 / NBRC 0793 / NRRL Y-1031 F-60-10) TaxID=1206466 RepID=K0KBS1_WICCF|nr:RNA polymerase I-specific transcription initiation factor RRN11 [Wickerhamomyces ciferrii]CCH42510.1 RNA polymerase I-specific transcription initiation factor RRN11 [Wickerhamomyces ciferrii]